MRFHILKHVFLTAAKEELSDRDDVIPQMLMGIVRDLMPGEVLVLSSAYKKRNDEDAIKRAQGAQGWLTEVVNGSPLKLAGIVEFYEQRLVEKYLLTGRVYADRSGIRLGEYFRLTDLGVRICEFLQGLSESE